jgi:cytochrome c oxidase cbb3-type subunit 3
VLQTVLDGREGAMPPWGQVLEGIGGEHAVLSATAYVRSLSQGGIENNYFAAQGERLYGSLCVACHGQDGKGDPTVGAPDLTDDYWLYGDSNEQIAASIANGRHGSMPAHRALLGETRARVVAAYVWSLSSHGRAQDARAAATQ